MTETAIDLRQVLRGSPLVDLDVLPDDQWIGVVQDAGATLVSFNGATVRAPKPCSFPIVRWIDHGKAVLVDARTDNQSAHNAWVIGYDGTVHQSFFAGDGIQDVLASAEHIVITYFDEGVFGPPGPNKEGVAVFSSDGSLILGYASEVGEPDIADCYCACWAGSDEIVFIPYTEFPFVRFDLRRRRSAVTDLPEKLHGAAAVCARGQEAAFWSPYDHKYSLLRWNVGSSDFEIIGSHAGPLRGLTNGRMLSVGTSGYTILDLLS